MPTTTTQTNRPPKDPYTITLAPCPWCQIEPDLLHFGPYWDIECRNNRCPVQPSVTKVYSTAEGVIAAWCSRRQEDLVDEEGNSLDLCTDCGIVHVRLSSPEFGVCLKCFTAQEAAEYNTNLDKDDLPAEIATDLSRD